MGLDGAHRGGDPLTAPGGDARCEVGDEVDAGGDPGQQLVGQGAELEPLRHRVAGGEELVGGEPLEQCRRGGEGTEVRAEELVRRAGQQVRAERGHVDGCMRGEVHPVDVHQRVDLVGRAADLGDVGAGAEQVGGGGDRDQPGVRGQHGLEVVELGGVGVEAEPAHSRPGPLGPEHPGTDVGIVVEPGHHDLVPGTPVRAQGAGQVEGQRGHRPAEHDAPRVGAEQVAHRGTGVPDDPLGPLLGVRDGAAVGDAGGHRRRHRLRDLRGRLRPTRSVEVGHPERERGEVAADLVGVECGHVPDPSDRRRAPR